MSNEVRLSELYHHAYEGVSTTPDDEIHHQLMNGLGCLMNVSDNLDDRSRGVAFTTIASAVARFRTRGECPSSMYFAETFDSISFDDRARVLQITIPQLVSTSLLEDNAWWFIEAAIQLDLCSLLHLTFVEDALVSPDPMIRAFGTRALIEIPMSYWDEVQQHERRALLIERALKDEHELVRKAVTSHPNHQP